MKLLINECIKNKLKDIVVTFTGSDGKYIGDDGIIYQIAMHYRVKINHIMFDFRCSSKVNQTIDRLNKLDEELKSACEMLVGEDNGEELYNNIEGMIRSLKYD